MGINYDGGMIVGCCGSELPEFTDGDEDATRDDWAYEHGLERMHLWPESSDDNTYYGFKVDDILVSDIKAEWVEELKVKALKFFELTGVHAGLIGVQDIS